jgi:hypothetical protein
VSFVYGETDISESFGFDHSVGLIGSAPIAFSQIAVYSQLIPLSLTFPSCEKFECSGIADGSQRVNVSKEFVRTCVGWRSEAIDETQSFPLTPGSASGPLNDSRFAVESAVFGFSNLFSASICWSVSNGFHDTAVRIDCRSSDHATLAPSSTFSPPSGEQGGKFTAAATDVEIERASRMRTGIAMGMVAGIVALIVVVIICLVVYVFVYRRNSELYSVTVSEGEELQPSLTSLSYPSADVLEFRSSENMLASDIPDGLFDCLGQSEEC